MQFMVLLENRVKKTMFPKLFFLAFRSVLIHGFGELWGKYLDPGMIE